MDKPTVATSLNRLARLYYKQEQYALAEPLYKRALAINEKAFGPESPDVAANLNNLAYLYDKQGQYALSEPLFKRAMAIYEKSYGPDSPELAQILKNLETLHQKIIRKRVVYVIAIIVVHLAIFLVIFIHLKVKSLWLPKKIKTHPT
jgi:tetratricopeptide (TPR) repeat protein